MKNSSQFSPLDFILDRIYHIHNFSDTDKIKIQTLGQGKIIPGLDIKISSDDLINCLTVLDKRYKIESNILKLLKDKNTRKSIFRFRR